MNYAARSKENMIANQLVTNRVLDTHILEAMALVPRESYVGSQLQGVAYVDAEVEIAQGRYLLEPLVQARLLQLAEVAEADKVLDIGCATGYSTALVSHLAAHVTGVEAQRDLADRARQLLRRANIANAEVVCAPHSEGHRPSMPYNVILINGALKHDPSNLYAQLAEGGRLVFIKNISLRPGMKSGLGKITVSQKLSGQIYTKIHMDASAPLLPGFADAPSFVF